MKRLIIITTLLTIITLTNDMLFAKKEKDKSTPLGAASSQVTEVVTDTTNIHYTNKYCTECHEKRPQKGGDKFLKFGGDFTQLCRCHGYEAGNYIHPIDIEPSKEKMTKIPNDLPLRDGKVSCTTCHDVYMQCKESPELKLSNRRFIRGAPFQRRTDLCFRCHDETKYKMLDPHNQLDAKGNIVVEKCLYCHVEKPDVERAFFKKPESGRIHGREVKLIGDLNVLCQRCHGILDKHPVNAEHLVKPSEKTLSMMKKAEKQYGIILPLNYEDKITCATCHNPHEQGIIPESNPASIGADKEKRLRLPAGVRQELCLACHDIRYP